MGSKGYVTGLRIVLLELNGITWKGQLQQRSTRDISTTDRAFFNSVKSGSSGSSAPPLPITLIFFIIDMLGRTSAIRPYQGCLSVHLILHSYTSSERFSVFLRFHGFLGLIWILEFLWISEIFLIFGVLAFGILAELSDFVGFCGIFGICRIFGTPH